MDGTGVSFDTVLTLCRDGHRRIVLGVLAAERRGLTANDLTTTIVRYGHDASPTDVSSETTRRIRTSLQHRHLPMIAEAGLIEYAAERELVEPTPTFDRVEPRLSTIIEADPELSPPLEL